MKKIIALILALTMCLTLAACGGNNTVDNDSNGVSFNQLNWNGSDVYYNNDDGTFDAITTEEGITLTSATPHRFLISAEDESSWSYIVSPYDQVNLDIEGGKIVSIVFYGYDGIPLGGDFDEVSWTLAFSEPSDTVTIPATDENDETIVDVIMTISNAEGQLFVVDLDRADIRG